jgi:hypothetical protein
MMANQPGNIRVVFHYIDRRLHATIVAGKCFISIPGTWALVIQSGGHDSSTVVSEMVRGRARRSDELVQHALGQC